MAHVRTSDIILAATLVCNNYRLDNLSVNTLGRGTFEFDGVDDKVLLTYQSGGLLVRPQEFNDALVALSRQCRHLSR